MLLVVVGVILLFGMTVFVHELGHFLVAKYLGLQIDAFSIGFGKALWKKKVNGIEYRIGMLPLGGYVALPQMDPTGSQTTIETGKADSGHAPPVAAWKKIPVALAGGVMNILFAFLIATVIWKVGIQQSILKGPSVIKYIEKGSAAETAGIQFGDRVLTVNGEKVRTWEDVIVEVALGARADLEIAPTDGGAVRKVSLPVEFHEDEKFYELATIGPAPEALIGRIIPDSAAVDAGLKAGDLIVEADGRDIHHRGEFVEVISEGQGKTIDLGILRDGERIHLSVTPREMTMEGNTRWMVGVDFSHLSHPPPKEQMQYFAFAIFRTFKAFSRPSERKQAFEQIGGPVRIFHLLGVVLANGFMQALFITALINVNLAIINLLPFPVLDGGHICFALYEVIFRKPMPERALRPLVMGGFIILLCLFVTLTYRDIGSLARQYFPDKKVPATESAPALAPEAPAASDSSSAPATP